MPRTNSYEQRIKKLEKDMRQQKEASHKNAEAAKENKREIQEMKYREARHMLQEKKSNGNYLYSYKEIAEELGISVGTVSNIAAQYGLSRLSAV
jgi:DNA invertase Pin-like site-specific DNA recombinase